MLQSLNCHHQHLGEGALFSRDYGEITVLFNTENIKKKLSINSIQCPIPCLTNGKGTVFFPAPSPDHL